MKKRILITILPFLYPVVCMANLDDGLAAYYPFDGNAQDASGNGNHGVVQLASLTTDRFGMPAASYDFNGTSSRIVVPDAPGLELTNDLTISSWILPRATNTLHNILAKHNAGDNSRGTWTFRVNKGAIDFQGRPYFDDQLRSGSVTTGIWQHVAFTYKRATSEWTLYINGIVARAGIRSYSIQDTNEPMTIGCEGHPSFSPPYYWFFNGKIDELRIYSRALSASEILQLAGLSSGQFTLKPQKIFLAFDQPSSFKLIVVPLAFGRSWPIVEPFSSMPAATVNATYRASVTAQVKSIFSRSGVNNIDWVTADSDDAVAVYFCPLINPDILGYSRGAPDRFNSKRRGEVIVFVNESSPLANLDAESAAHEIGHSLGLRHVDPSAADPLNNEVMDLDFSSDPQFTNTISDITDITSFATHNPRYHLLRYIDGWSSAQLQNESIEPGTWDSGTSVFTKLSFQGANLRLHNITLYASGGDVESTFVLDQISSATLSELSQRSFTIPKGMKVTLLASSAEGGPPDVISATGDPFVGENQHVAIDAATTPFSLYRQDSPTVAVPIASATADSDLTTPFCNLALTPPNILRLDFRGALQQSTNLSDWSDIGLDATSPHFIVIPPGQGARFFRSKQPATP